jgi:hypothetical protein
MQFVTPTTEQCQERFSFARMQSGVVEIFGTKMLRATKENGEPGRFSEWLGR